MLDKYVFGAHAVLLVYDVTSVESFERLASWLSACRSALQSQEKPPTYALIANKIDLEHLRAIKSDRHHKFAQEHGLLTYAVSAKTGEGVSLCLQKISADLLGIRLSKQEQEQQQAVVKAEIVQYKEDSMPRNPQANNSSDRVLNKFQAAAGLSSKELQELLSDLNFDVDSWDELPLEKANQAKISIIVP